MDAVVAGMVKQVKDSLALVQTDVDDLQSVVTGLQTSLTALSSKLDSVSAIIDAKSTLSSLAVNSTAYIDIPIPAGANRMIIKAIHVEASLDAAIGLEILSSTVDLAPFKFYTNTIGANILYDVVELLYIDDDASGKLHLKLTNAGIVTSAFKIRILGITSN